VHRFEGTVNQFTGDGIMALFGTHRPRGPSPTRHPGGLRDAGGPERLRAELDRQQGIDLKLRIGVHTGEVVVAAIGDNLRMDYTAQTRRTWPPGFQAMAPLGGASVSEQTIAASRDTSTARIWERFRSGRESARPHIPATGAEVEALLDEAKGRHLARLVGRDRELHFLQRGC
jgi:hypothetical protein